MIWLRYALLVLMVPAYIIALKRQWWTTLPLWLISTSVMLTQLALSAQQSSVNGGLPQASTLVYACEMTKIMIIPVAVQLAVILKGWQSRAANPRGARPSVLVASLDAGEL